MTANAIPLVRECTAQECRFRYPIPTLAEDRPRCPLCGGPTWVPVSQASADLDPPVYAPRTSGPVWPVEVLVDNVRSLHNVGSILRTADGAGVRHIHLAGITPQPDHPKIVKTSLGAELAVPWTYHRNGVDAASALAAQGLQIWALDIYANGTPLPVAVGRLMPRRPNGQAVPILLVVGSEKTGIDPHIVAQAHELITIPMLGSKRSLNVSVAFGIAAYFLTQSDQAHS